MDTIIKGPRILPLGIPLDAHTPPEKILADRLLEEVDQPTDAPVELPFDKIPKVFTSISEWPRSTNLRCWECGQQFDSPPKFICTYVVEDESTPSGFSLGVLGNYCSFNDAALAISKEPPKDRPKYRENLLIEYYLFTGTRVSEVRPAVPRTAMAAYGGGTLSMSQWWSANRALDPRHGPQDYSLGSIRPDRDRTAPAPERLGDARFISMWSVSLEDGAAEREGVTTPVSQNGRRAGGARADAWCASPTRDQGGVGDLSHADARRASPTRDQDDEEELYRAAALHGEGADPLGLPPAEAARADNVACPEGALTWPGGVRAPSGTRDGDEKRPEGAAEMGDEELSALLGLQPADDRPVAEMGDEELFALLGL